MRPRRSSSSKAKLPVVDSIKAEIAIIGAGPAGATLGIRLAQLGHDVCILEKQRFPRDHVGESLPPSIEPLLDFIGVKAEVDHAGFPRSSGAWIRWDGATQFRESPLPGYQVNRARFDAILLDAARVHGVRVLEATRYEPGQLDATIIADASGRRSISGGVKRQMGARTLSLYSYWEGKPWPDSCSRVEALDHGWLWAAPLSNEKSIVATFVDPSSHADYETFIRQATLIPQGGQPGPIHVCDSTPWMSDSMAEPGLIRVGEAAFAIDPLSSQGVQTAIASALQASVVVHTMLCRPRDAAMAIAFYQARQQAAAIRHAGIAAELYTKACSVHQTLFWKARTDLPNVIEPQANARISGDLVVPAPVDMGHNSGL